MASESRDFGRIRGVAVGQAESDDVTTGVTVVTFDGPVPTVVDVRGGASGTYDTASLSLDATFGGRWALFLTGGSLFGLDAARGIRTQILERGGGVRPFGNPNLLVPVSGAVLFDLPRRRSQIPDYAELGYRAARRARRGPVAIGPVGAGAGATVGKYLGRDRAMPGGLGVAVGPAGTRGTIGVIVAVNSVGAIRDPSNGAWVAGARGRNGGIVPPGSEDSTTGRARGTTIGIVVTDLAIERGGLARIAAEVHSGLATAISPYQCALDGDTLFVSTTEKIRRAGAEAWPGELADDLGRRGAELAARAVLAAVRPAPNRPRAARSGRRRRAR